MRVLLVFAVAMSLIVSSISGQQQFQAVQTRVDFSLGAPNQAPSVSSSTEDMQLLMFVNTSNANQDISAKFFKQDGSIATLEVWANGNDTGPGGSFFDTVLPLESVAVILGSPNSAPIDGYAVVSTPASASIGVVSQKISVDGVMHFGRGSQLVPTPLVGKVREAWLGWVSNSDYGQLKLSFGIPKQTITCTIEIISNGAVVSGAPITRTFLANKQPDPITIGDLVDPSIQGSKAPFTVKISFQKRGLEVNLNQIVNGVSEHIDLVVTSVDNLPDPQPVSDPVIRNPVGRRPTPKRMKP